MAFRNRRKEKEQPLVKVEKEKTLDVDASMQGSLTFRDPVNLRINGKFEGSLNTKGSLTVGESAQVEANIIGEDVKICGKVSGNVTVTNKLSISRTAHLIGDIRTPSLSIDEGAVFEGKCQMDDKEAKFGRSTIQQTLMTVEELAKYLEVDTASVSDWAKTGKIPAEKQGNSWKFDRAKVDVWIASEKIK